MKINIAGAWLASVLLIDVQDKRMCRNGSRPAATGTTEMRNTSEKKLRPARLDTIQILRFLAVLAVIVSHSFHELVDLIGGRAPLFDEKLFPGDFGVDLFFVISGFIMVYVSRDHFGSAPAALDYMRRRIVRIVPLYWTMTTVMIAVVLLLPNAVDTATADPRQWIASYLFVPFERSADGMMRPVLGLGWSLNYEMFFYAIFACCMLLPRRLAIPAAVVLLFATHLAGQTALSQVPAIRYLSHPVIFEFAAGMLLGWAFVTGLRISPLLCAGLVAAGVALLFSAPRFDEGMEAARHIRYGIPALLIVAAVTLGRGADAYRGSRLAVSAGDASYATYLTHPFVLGVLTLVFRKSELAGSVDPAALFTVYLLVAISGSLVTGHLVHWLYDRPLTAFLERLSRRRPSAALATMNGA